MPNNKENLTLNHRLAAIGFRIYFSEPEMKLEKLALLEEVDLEETLIRAAFEAKSDFRVLSILLTWITVHADYVIVEKFAKKRKIFEKIQGINRILNLVAAQAVNSGSHKWKKLLRTNPKHFEIPVDPELLELSLQFQGANEELKKYGILIPKKFLRIRQEDVLTPSELSRFNPQYKNRLLYGASWRADIITAIEAGAKNPSQISRIMGCSYEPAYRVFKDYEMAQGAVA
jgi:hypothetical protein